jgi:hypothetical protein
MTHRKKEENPKLKQTRALLHRAIKVSIKTAQEVEQENADASALMLSGVNILEHYGESILVEYDFSSLVSGKHWATEKIIYNSSKKEENK